MSFDAGLPNRLCWRFESENPHVVTELDELHDLLQDECLGELRKGADYEGDTHARP